MCSYLTTQIYFAPVLKFNLYDAAAAQYICSLCIQLYEP